ncbi:hypothetical protein [Streptomyces sp. NPDC058694]|uniref:hypothetical protein n=1 Tax=Streptomyces sp. NPDC058694 TaxID=3346603 RepID=UPI003656FB7B
MSDSILVRVRLDRYDLMSNEKQTQVYAQIPEVGRASWLLPAEMFHGLKDRDWPEVLDVANDHYTHGWDGSDDVAKAARAAVMEWLRDDANRDEVQATCELDQARRLPFARKLLEENERLRVRLAELEDQNGTVFRASHDSIVIGLYTTAAEARKHCEAFVRREYTGSGISDLTLSWREDEETVARPEDGEQELIESIGPHFNRPTGYVVTPLEVASEYDAEADE